MTIGDNIELLIIKAQLKYSKTAQCKPGFDDINYVTNT